MENNLENLDKLDACHDKTMKIWKRLQAEQLVLGAYDPDSLRKFSEAIRECAIEMGEDMEEHDRKEEERQRELERWTNKIEDAECLLAERDVLDPKDPNRVAITGKLRALIAEFNAERDARLQKLIQEVMELDRKYRKYLYFMLSGKYVKIGISNDPWKRINQLQGGAANQIYLIGCLGKFTSEEAERREKLLHREFGSIRQNGEWFEFDEKHTKRLSRILLFARTSEEDVNRITEGIGVFRKAYNKVGLRSV